MTQSETTLTYHGTDHQYASNFIVITVPADGLAPNGARPSAVTVMTRFGSRIYMGLALEGLDLFTVMAINYLLIYTLGFLYISSSGSANAQRAGCFLPWTFSLNIGLNMFPLDSFMPCLHSLLGYSTGKFQALQLIVLAAFGPVD